MLPTEKLGNTVGSPEVPFRKVMDGIIYVLRTDASGKCGPQDTALVPHATGGSRNGSMQMPLKRI